ncbi:MAG: hypothetical protein COA41_15605 [Sphingopyxis sp.]|nr:MAG: hypothetical protein COA41_15605 [Sphingopyxis sp.]
MNKYYMALVLGGALPLTSFSATAAHAATKEGRETISIPAPPEGQGQIVFFRTGGQGFAMGCSVNENDEKVSSLGAGRYFMMVADPGPHSFSAKSEATDTLNLEVEPDETQYVRCKIKMGFMAGRPDLAPSSKAEFDELSHKLKMVDDDDMGPLARRVEAGNSSE